MEPGTEAESQGGTTLTCRLAEREKTACPLCGKVVSRKTLAHSHTCRADAATRAQLQEERARARVEERMRRLQADREAAQLLEQRRAKYANLALF